MTRYIALLRAVNVGGTGSLPMAELKALCVKAGFTRVQTYIASGNVLFDSRAGAATVKAELESRLLAHAGKPVGVLLRTAAEMTAVLEQNPFPRLDPRLTHAFFLDGPPPASALEEISGRADEELRLGKREIYVHYPAGMGHSKLKIKAARQGTARNMNTVAKLVELAARP
jgi:uncharacterized protein (DUF1697 family)